MGQAGPYTACAVLARHGYGSGLEAAVMGFTGARNDKPPAGMRGGLTPVGETDYAEVAYSRVGIFTRLFWSCQTPQHAAP